jgi:hypothetical protein
MADQLTAERDSEQARLEANVVQAALAERRAGLHLRDGSGHIPPQGADAAWGAALDAYYVAVDALLAFLQDKEAANVQ